jgi:hypothetical protein
MSDSLNLKQSLACGTKIKKDYYPPLGHHFRLQRPSSCLCDQHICASAKRIRTQLTEQVEQRQLRRWTSKQFLPLFIAVISKSSTEKISDSAGCFST